MPVQKGELEFEKTEVIKKKHRRMGKRILTSTITVVLLIASVLGVSRLYSSDVFAPGDAQVSTIVVVTTTTSLPPTVMPTFTATIITATVETTSPTTIETGPSKSTDELSAWEDLKLAPELAGAIKAVKEIEGIWKPIYEAIADNPYGAEVGEYLGDFYKNVELEGKQVGGVVLFPKIAEYLLKESINNISNDQEKWIAFIPADISNINDGTKIIMEIIDTKPEYNFPKSGLKVYFGEYSVSISNPVINSETVGVSNAIVTNLFPGMSTSIGYSNFPGNSINQDCFMVSGNLELIGEMNNKNYFSFGQLMAKTNQPICISFSSQIALSQINHGKIFSIGNSPLFVKIVQ